MNPRARGGRPPCVAVEPGYRTYQGDDGAELLDFVVSLNKFRRHLTPSQLSMVAATVANMKHGGDRRADQAANLRLDGGTDGTAKPLVTNAQAAEMFGVGERSVEHARKVQEQGVPELAEQVIAGNVSVSSRRARRPGARPQNQ